MFRNENIAFSSLDIKVREELEATVANNGGRISTHVTTSTTRVVTACGNSAKCVAARQHNIPLVPPSWIVECVKEGKLCSQQDAEKQQQQIGPLTGYRVSATCVPADARAELSKIVTQNGGKYSGQLDVHATHLVVGTQSLPQDLMANAKYAFARSHKVHCVHHDVWLQGMVTGLVAENVLTALCAVTKYPEHADLAKLRNDVEELVQQGKKKRVLDTHCTLKSQYEELHKEQQKVAATTATTTTAAPPPASSSLSSFPHLAKLTYEPETARYLSDVVAYVVGLDLESASDAATAFKARRVLSGACAKVLPVLVPSCSHVIVGVLNAFEEESLRLQCTRIGLPLSRIVVLDWLFDCYDAKQELPVSSYAFCFNKHTNEKVHVEGENQPQQPVMEETKSVPVIQDMPEFKKQPTPTPQQQHQSSLYPRLSDVFQGKSFLLSASFHPERQQQVLKYLIQHGAEHVASSSPSSTIRGDTQLCYTVVPNGHETIRGSAASAITDVQQQQQQTCSVVTFTWIVACVTRESIIDPQEHIFYHKPVVGSSKKPSSPICVYVLEKVIEAEGIPRSSLSDLINLLPGGSVAHAEAHATHVVVEDDREAERRRLELHERVLESARKKKTKRGSAHRSTEDVVTQQHFVPFAWLEHSLELGCFVDTPALPPMPLLTAVVDDEDDEQAGATATSVPQAPPPSLATAESTPQQPQQNSRDTIDPDAVAARLHDVAAITSQHHNSQPRVFCFSLVSADDSRNYIILRDAIVRLGGELCEDVREATHLVCSEPSQRESVLTALARGIWLLQPTYLDECARTMSWAPEAPYEWNRNSVKANARASTLHLASACRHWRERRERGGATSSSSSSRGAFHDMRLLLCTAGKTDAYVKILRAGGAVTVDTTRAVDTTSIDSLPSQYSHVLFDKVSWSPTVTETVMSVVPQDTACRFFLVDWISYHIQCLNPAVCTLWPRAENLVSAKRRKVSALEAQRT
eukprot:PhM_4_TR10200/c0_g1_i1/m.40887